MGISRRAVAVGAALALALTVAGVGVSPAQAATQPYRFKNCTALNKVYKHGVGRVHAKDKTSGKPVTTFKHSDALYKKVIKYRAGLDRDKDGIACEKR
jgi:hypothetical protein